MSRGRPAPLVKFQHIIQLFTVLLTAILISLFFAALVLVGKIQGTARVVNYAGLVRGKTQRIVSSELDLVRLDDADFQAKMTALSSEFDDLRNELILVRQRGMNGRLVKPLDAKKLAKSIREAVQNQQ